MRRSTRSSTRNVSTQDFFNARQADPVTPEYDAILIVSFGGPEGPDDVIPFLENVLRGKNVPRARMDEVAAHYRQFGGVSPINQQNRNLIAALEAELSATNIHLPVYWGNRNWHPLLPDTMQQMKKDGVRNALAFVTSAYSAYSNCRQYLDDLQHARQQVGPGAPTVDKLRAYYNHPGFIEPMVEHVRDALDAIPAERRDAARLVFTAHSIPTAMAQASPYVEQLTEACSLVSAALHRGAWQLTYQSRSGPPHQPWLEPDVCDAMADLASQDSCRDVVLVPIGFVSDHMEVLYDLDTEACQRAAEVGISIVRAKTVGTHPRFVRMISDLIREQTENAPRLSLGTHGPHQDVCPADCCTWEQERARLAGSKSPAF